ncbi:MAG: FAD-binding protein [Desulfatiglandales bacterium]|nr:FAD-binding protein [Desulfatiglandales bacterium]
MKLSKLNVVSCDVLVIGGGDAGLRAAIEAGEMGADVLVVFKYRAG